MQVGKVDYCSDRGGRLVLLVSKIVMSRQKYWRKQVGMLV